MPGRPDFYAVLGVQPEAPAEVVTGAYRALCRLYHPDVNPDTEATERMKLINEAYDTLSDPAKRAAYDRQRPATGPSQAAAHTTSSTPPPPPPPPPLLLPQLPAPPSPAPVSLQDQSAPVISIAGVRGRRGRCTARNFRVRVRIRDGSGLRSARLVIDGRRRRTTTRKRFGVLIRASRLRGGRHRLTVTATDRAGNRGSRSVRFTRCARPS
jgi:curved DNA-binding protein CbpA